MPQLDISSHQVKSPVLRMGYILLSHWPRGSHDTLKRHRLFLGIPVAPHNLMLKPHCKSHHLDYIIDHEEVKLFPTEFPTGVPY